MNETEFPSDVKIPKGALLDKIEDAYSALRAMVHRLVA
jgi:hypothetical protein